MKSSKFLTVLTIAVLLTAAIPSIATVKTDADLQALKWRNIGPFNGGRGTTVVGHPTDKNVFWFGHGSGGLWKTTNNGITWDPIFENEGSYALGVVTLDPSNPHTVWVGTGENNAHSYLVPGDGVYRSADGGKSWKNTGLKESQQIGEIVVHPEDQNTVWGAAYGSHRKSGGDR